MKPTQSYTIVKINENTMGFLSFCFFGEEDALKSLDQRGIKNMVGLRGLFSASLSI